MHNSTKNCSGVVVGGCLGCNHQRSKRAETTHESHLCKYHCLVHSPSSDKRWAIRETGASIDRMWVLSSTHWAGNLGMLRSSSLFFCLRHLCWPSRMMRIGEASGIPTCLNSFVCQNLTGRRIRLKLLRTLRPVAVVQNSQNELLSAVMASCVCA